MASYQMEVGRLLCGTVRDFLAAEKVKGRAIHWHEGSGFLSRVFTVGGSVEDVAAIRNTLTTWGNRINAEDTADQRGH